MKVFAAGCEPSKCTTVLRRYDTLNAFNSPTNNSPTKRFLLQKPAEVGYHSCGMEAFIFSRNLLIVLKVSLTLALRVFAAWYNPLKSMTAFKKYVLLVGYRSPTKNSSITKIICFPEHRVLRLLSL